MDPGRGPGTDFEPILVGSTRLTKVALLFQCSVEPRAEVAAEPPLDRDPWASFVCYWASKIIRFNFFFEGEMGGWGGISSGTALTCIGTLTPHL